MAVVVKTSNIQGDGVFSVYNMNKNNVVGVVIDFDKDITYIGSKINHSWTPNCRIIYDFTDKQYYLITNREVNAGEELTADYRFTPAFIMKPDHRWL